MDGGHRNSQPSQLGPSPSSKADRPALLAQYRPNREIPRNAARLLIPTICPRRRWIIAGSTASIEYPTLDRFTRSIRSNASPEKPRAGVVIPTPALATSRSTGPSSEVSLATADRIATGSVASAVATAAVPPSERIKPAICSSSGPPTGRQANPEPFASQLPGDLGSEAARSSRDDRDLSGNLHERESRSQGID